MEAGRWRKSWNRVNSCRRWREKYQTQNCLLFTEWSCWLCGTSFKNWRLKQRSLILINPLSSSMSLLHCRQVRHNDEKAKGWSWRDSREPLVRRGLLSKRCGFLKLSVLLAFNAISQSSLFVPWPCFLIARNWNWDETWERGRWGLIIIIIIIKIIRLRSRHTTRIVMYIDYHQSSFNNISMGIRWWWGIWLKLST